MGETIAVFAAHGDDEVLGCGGTIAKHRRAGDKVHLIVMSDGESSREHSQSEELIASRQSSTESAAEILGINSVTYLGFPDNRMDEVSLLTLAKSTEEMLEKLRPSIIYTHHPGDLNIDHRLTYQSVITASRPMPSSFVRRILSFEVLSSSEWNWGSGMEFSPNYFVDISFQMETKLDAIMAYASEMRDSPHTRSIENVETLAKLRGASVGVERAEAFILQFNLDT